MYIVPVQAQQTSRLLIEATFWPFEHRISGIPRLPRKRVEQCRGRELPLGLVVVEALRVVNSTQALEYNSDQSCWPRWRILCTIVRACNSVLTGRALIVRWNDFRMASILDGRITFASAVLVRPRSHGTEVRGRTLEKKSSLVRRWFWNMPTLASFCQLMRKV